MGYAKISIEGHTIHYFETGSHNAIAVLFIHGWLNTHKLWRETLPSLERYYHCYALDLPGHGDSSDPQTPYYATIEGFVDIVERFIEEQGLKKCIVVGHSMGGMTAIELASRRPDLLHSMVLVDAAVTGRLGPPLDIVQKYSPVVYRALLKLSKSFPFLFKRTSRQFYYGADSNTDWAELIGYASKHSTRYQIQNLVSIGEHDMTEKLKSIKVPSLILSGQYDRTVSTDQARLLNETLGDTDNKLVFLPRSAHMPMLEKSSEFNSLLLDFFDDGVLNQSIHKKGSVTQNRITEIVSRKRFDVDFPPLSRPAPYEVVEIRDKEDKVVGKGTVWRTSNSDPHYALHSERWVRIWGDTRELEVGYEVKPLKRTNYLLKVFDINLKLGKRIFRSLGYPRSDISQLEPYPPLEDRQLSEALREIVESAVYEMGFAAASLGSMETGNVIPARFLRVKSGWEWMVEWGQELFGIDFEGQILNLSEQPNHPASVSAQKAMNGEAEVYVITHDLKALIGYVVPKDGFLIWLMQFLLGLRTLINLTFYIHKFNGDVEIIGNMYAGHSSGRMSQRDKAAFISYCKQAALSIQNYKLYRLEEDRALQAESMYAISQFGSRMTHRIIGEISAARLQVEGVLSMAEQDTYVHQSLGEIFQQLGEIIDLTTLMKKPFHKVDQTELQLRPIIDKAQNDAHVPDNIHVHIGLEIDDYSVVADDNLLEVFRVLFRNAVEAIEESSEGEITISGRNVGRGHYRIDFKDNGKGIPPELHEEVFKQFATTKKHGNGIGLWWSRFYLRRIGGEILLEKSAPNRGTSFNVILPRTQEVGSPTHQLETPSLEDLW